MGPRILYYLVVLPVSKLPFWALYRLSEVLCFVVFKLIGYRRKIIRSNLQNSFPEKGIDEIKRIEKIFCLHFCDLVMESIKAFSISKEEAFKRMKDRNIELVNKYKASGKHVVMVGGHYGNWELFAITIGAVLEYKSIALYTPLRNQFLNQKITASRSKYGLEMLGIKTIKERINAANSDLYTIIFGADQSPRKDQRAYWMKFLNQETGIQFGTEKFAVEFDAVVIFANIYKVKRGFYEVEYTLITEDAKSHSYGEITKRHVGMLEEVINKQPEYWLWSHRRWKHKRPEGEVLN